MNKLVEDAGNTAAVQAAVAVPEKEEAEHVFIFGPAQSGKTTLLQEVEMGNAEKKRPALYRAAMQIMNTLQFEDAPDEFFEQIGTAPVLLLDDFQDFYVAGEGGPLFAKLMLEERAKNGLSTIITCNVPMAELDKDVIEHALDDFTEYEVKPLGSEGRQEFVKLMAKTYSGSEAPTLGDDAIAFLANDFSEDLKDVRNAVHYLVEAAGFNASDTVSADKAKDLLK